MEQLPKLVNKAHFKIEKIKEAFTPVSSKKFNSFYLNILLLILFIGFFLSWSVQPNTKLSISPNVIIPHNFSINFIDDTKLLKIAKKINKKQTLKLHFDMHHGYGNLDKAIDLMDFDDKDEFRKFVNTSTSFNPHIMFIAKPTIAKKWFSKLFSWLFRCEKVFGFHNLSGYDTTRLYAYLAERYLSFWFKKYTKYIEWPVATLPL
jgi:hypothetical protein